MTILSVEIKKETVSAANTITQNYTLQPLMCNVCTLFWTQNHETVNDSTIMFKYRFK